LEEVRKVTEISVGVDGEVRTGSLIKAYSVSATPNRSIVRKMLSIYQTSESDEFDIVETYINEMRDEVLRSVGMQFIHARTHARMDAVFSVIQSLMYCELSELILSRTDCIYPLMALVTGEWGWGRESDRDESHSGWDEKESVSGRKGK